MAERRREVALLDGVPGAGKTEVYFEAVAEALRGGRRVLVLLPEIALSAQWLARFERRFGVQPAAWHSALTPAQRRNTWRLIAEGRIHVVVGARSALFLPLTELGLLVVDEEHDMSFKQGEGVPYHARDMALARARFEGCPAILATATPSIETAIGGGRHRRRAQGPARLAARAPARRATAGRRCRRSASSTCASERPPRGGFLSPPLRQALLETLAAEGQSLLFINRRGYAPLTLCRACGYRLACSNCSAWLVAHRLRGRLSATTAATPSRRPSTAPPAAASACWSPPAPASSAWPRRWRTSCPTPASRDDQRHGPDARAAAELVAAVERREVDVLIGTQIIAKGHHFPD